MFVFRFFKSLDYVDPAKAAIWGWVKASCLFLFSLERYFRPIVCLHAFLSCVKENYYTKQV